MSLTRIAEAVLNTNAGLLGMALEGLTDADLAKRPNDQTNPIGWLLWHNARVEDAMFSALDGVEQAWLADQWHRKFGMDADPADTGVGHNLKQVAELKTTIGHLKGYVAAVRPRTLTYLRQLTADRLESEVPTILGDKRILGDYIAGFLVDHLHHSGHVTYLRGYISGMGWFPM